MYLIKCTWWWNVNLHAYTGPPACDHLHVITCIWSLAFDHMHVITCMWSPACDHLYVITCTWSNMTCFYHTNMVYTWKSSRTYCTCTVYASICSTHRIINHICVINLFYVFILYLIRCTCDVMCVIWCTWSKVRDNKLSIDSAIAWYRNQLDLVTT